MTFWIHNRKLVWIRYLGFIFFNAVQFHLWRLSKSDLRIYLLQKKTEKLSEIKTLRQNDVIFNTGSNWNLLIFFKKCLNFFFWLIIFPNFSCLVMSKILLICLISLVLMFIFIFFLIYLCPPPSFAILKLCHLLVLPDMLEFVWLCRFGLWSSDPQEQWSF